MALPVTFGALAQGKQNASLFDQQFAALGALVHIPCTAAGQNAVVLTPAANTPAITAYTDLAPAFAWVQAQTCTGAVTIAVSGLQALNAYRNNGQTAIGSGDLVAGFAYQAFPVSTLNSGAGGWVVDAFTLAGVGAGVLKAITTYSGSQTITVPAAVTQAIVQMWGGSGGSGGVNNGASGGTGAGGYLQKFLTSLTPGNTIVYTQGGAGPAGAAAGNGGIAGNSTLASGTQTITTLTANGSAGTFAAVSCNQAGSAGGTATNGDINITGQTGGSGVAAGVACGGAGGRNFNSVGADGVASGGTAAGLPGNPGGLIIYWLT